MSTEEKNLDLLKGVSDYFNEYELKKAVATANNETPDDVEIFSWKFSEASAKGEGYLSVVDRVLIKSKINNAEIETKVIIKSLPKNIGRRKTFRSAEFFYNEITFYNEVAKRFIDYLHAKGQSQLLNIPRCLGSHLDGEHDFLVLEDVSVKGYGPLCRQSSLSYEQCKNSVETLARFHAISFGYKNEHKEDFEKMADLLIETFCSEGIYENWYKRFHNTVLLRIAKDALAKEYPGSEGEKVFNSYEPGALVKKCIQICSEKHVPTYVIGQGDTWAPNLLAREVAPEKFEILILDFQLARCCSPVLDVAFFIYSCTDQPWREKYYDQLLSDYYDELTKSMKLLGVNPETAYPRDVFQKEIKEQSVFGLTFALDAVPFTMMPEDEAFDLDEIIKGDNKVDIADVFTLPNIPTSENRRRLAEMILDVVNKGFI